PYAELKAVFRAKFIYYYPLAYVATMGLEALGEGRAVSTILASEDLGEQFRALTGSDDLRETLIIMEALIDRIARRYAMNDRRFLVEQRDFIVPIRYNSADVNDTSKAIEWGRRLFDIQ